MKSILSTIDYRCQLITQRLRKHLNVMDDFYEKQLKLWEDRGDDVEIEIFMLNCKDWAANMKVDRITVISEQSRGEEILQSMALESKEEWEVEFQDKGVSTRIKDLLQKALEFEEQCELWQRNGQEVLNRMKKVNLEYHTESSQSLVQHELRLITEKYHQQQKEMENLKRMLHQNHQEHEPIRSMERERPLHIKVPEYRIPTFDGTPELFEAFWDRFNYLIHENRDIDQGTKAHYLYEGLSGRATLTISGISPTGRNYERMRRALIDEYGYYKEDVAHVFQQLGRLRKAEPRADECAELLSTVKAITRRLEAAGYEPTAAWFYLSVAEKFPIMTVKRILREQDPQWSLDDIFSMIGVEIRIMRIEESNKADRRETKISTSQPMVVRRDQKEGCPLCKQNNHNILQCNKAGIAEKRNYVRERRLCWNCLKSGHRSSDCTQPKCQNCGRDHNIALCYPDRKPEVRDRKDEARETASAPKPWKGGPPPPKRENEGWKPPEAAFMLRDMTLSTGDQPIKENQRLEQEATTLKTVQANIYNYATESYQRVNIIIDEGSTISFIKEDLAKKLEMPVMASALKTFWGIGDNQYTHDTQEVKAIFVDNQRNLVVMELTTNPTIITRLKAPWLDNKDKEFLHKESIKIGTKLLNGELFEPDILIGADKSRAILMMNSERDLPSQLRIQNTIFGHTIYGNRKPPVQVETTLIQTEDPRQMMKHLFEVDSLGITTETAHENTEIDYFEAYSKMIKQNEQNRIVAPLPWKDNRDKLPNNRSMAYFRLKGLLKALETNAEKEIQYNTLFANYLKEGIIEYVEEPDKNLHHHYLPHHGVWNANKPQKPLRIVFDASSKRRGCLSLNDVLQTGESFVRKIHEVLIMIRTHPIIITADIKSAFLQIELSEKDRDYCRFFWKHWKIPSKIVTYRFRRLPFGLTAAPSILNMCLIWHLKRNKDNPLLAMEITKTLYADNLTLFAKSEEEAKVRCRTVIQMFEEVCIPLREFTCNRKGVLDILKPEQVTMDEEIKIFGVPFHQGNDLLFFKSDKWKWSKLTKRSTLGHLHTLYDPIGLIAPALLPLKLLHRVIGEKCQSWDDELPPEISREWRQMLQQFEEVRIPIKRNLEGLPEELWICVDASSYALAACAYLKHKQAHSPILAGRTKIGPKKAITIPRMELIALRLGMRLLKSIINSIKIQKVNIATDSMIVLNWIYGRKQLPRFMESQRREIWTICQEVNQKDIPISFWHVATEANPADIGSRGCYLPQLKESDWIHGPNWIENLKERTRLLKCWGPFIVITQEDTIKNEHIEKCMVQTEKEAQECNVSSDNTQTHTQEDEEFWFRKETLVENMKLIGYIMKLIKKWRRIDPNQSGQRSTTLQKLSNCNKPTAEDQELIRKLYLRQAQKDLVLEDVQKRYPQSQIVEDEEGIIRVRTRLNNSNLPEETKNPAFLPRKARLTKELVVQSHVRSGHQGRQFVLSELRQRYFIERPSVLIRQLLKRCSTCNRMQSRPFGLPHMPALPADRVVLTRPFRNTGCDLMGPLHTTDAGKVWTCLFTCLTTRAVHLEIVGSQSAQTFLNAFIRFVARRGLPRTVRSDCAGNFILGSKILEMFQVHEELRNMPQLLHEEFREEGINWIYNTPLSPWKGGVWERLIGLVKASLNKTFKGRPRKFDDLHTQLLKIEIMLNCRPLTHPDPDQLDKPPIRPVDFICPGMSFDIFKTVPVRIYEQTAQIPVIRTTEQIIETIQELNVTTDGFWERFYSEYLVYIRDIHKIAKRQGGRNHRMPQVGEVVIVKNDPYARAYWKMAVILELITSSDGKIRSARVRTAAGTMLTRSLDQLFPMEIRSAVINEMTANEYIQFRNKDAQSNNTETGAEESEDDWIIGPSQSSCYRASSKWFSCWPPLGKACIMYRLQHKPITEITYAVNICEDWITVVHLNIKKNLFGNNYERSIKLKPYSTLISEIGNITIIKQEKPNAKFLHRKFFISENQTYLTERHFEPMVKCDSKERAQKHFTTCDIQWVCPCIKEYEEKILCDCPESDFAKEAWKLTPQLININEREETIEISSIEDESTIHIESLNFIQSNIYTQDISCHINFLGAQGCYACETGAVLSFECIAEEETWIPLDCQHEVIMVKCSPQFTNTTVTIRRNYPMIREECRMECGGRETSINIIGVLRYDGRRKGRLPNKIGADEVPSYSPLWDVMRQRWIISLGILGIAVISTAACYLLAPMLMVQATMSMVAMMVKLKKTWDSCWARASQGIQTTQF